MQRAPAPKNFRTTFTTFTRTFCFRDLSGEYRHFRFFTTFTLFIARLAGRSVASSRLPVPSKTKPMPPSRLPRGPKLP
jgi:hypothetical protein